MAVVIHHPDKTKEKTLHLRRILGHDHYFVTHGPKGAGDQVTAAKLTSTQGTVHDGTLLAVSSATYWAFAFVEIPEGDYTLTIKTSGTDPQPQSLKIAPPRQVRLLRIDYPQPTPPWGSLGAPLLAYGISDGLTINPDRMVTNIKDSSGTQQTFPPPGQPAMVLMDPQSNTSGGWTVQFVANAPCTNAFTVNVQDNNGASDQRSGIIVMGATVPPFFARLWHLLAKLFGWKR
jgi:hypothetical protein